MMNKKQTIAIVVLMVFCINIVLVFIAGVKNILHENDPSPVYKEETDRGVAGQDGPEETSAPILQVEGKMLKTRVNVPEGYRRTKAGKDSFTGFVRNYPLKKDGSPVRYYNGKKKTNQDVHAAVFCLPIEKEDLQQCADSVMRMYAEYYWSTGQYDKIAFHFVDGFLAQYSRWRQGYRIQTSEGGTSWTKSTSEDTSYEAFQSYMRIVFSYASTLSMEQESKPIEISEIRVGDIFIKGGSPGHVVMVVDVCKNKEGEKAFLLAQGFMPAQEFHLLKNPLHEDDPWYYQTEFAWPLSTPEYVFERGSLMRPKY